MRYVQSLKKPTLLLALLTVLAPASGFAQGSAPAPYARSPKAVSAQAPQAGDGEKLDVSDLEKKYWAAKDSDFNVVQNRMFTKAGRFSLTGSYGSMINDAWSDGPTAGLNAGYYFNERWGVELTATGSNTKDNTAADRLKSQNGYPNNNKMKNFYGAQVDWVPFYGKVSLLNSSIVYFDMSASLGAGITQYDQQREEGAVTQNAPTVSLDISQHFFLNKWFAIRLDYKNRFYKEDILWYKQSSQIAAGASSRTDSSDVNHTTILMVGAEFFF